MNRNEDFRGNYAEERRQISEAYCEAGSKYESVKQYEDGGRAFYLGKNYQKALECFGHKNLF